jgi:hypothetical protein
MPMKSTHDELRSMIADATMADLERLVEAVDRWPRPTRVAVSLELARQCPDRRADLEKDLVDELVRSASAPLTRVARRVVGRREPDELHESVTISAARLGVSVKVPPGGTLRGRLGALTGALVDRAVRDLSPAEQQQLGIDVVDRIAPRTSPAYELARAATMPALHHLIGPTVLAKIVESILVQMTTMVLGRHFARAAVGAALARLPLGVALGPIAWGGGVAMAAWELQQPALRKLLPAFVTLGFVALRSQRLVQKN